MDTLVAVSPPSVKAAKDATNTIPIVMLLSYSDPVELGFVASFARPGGNITGVVLAAEPTIVGKRLELIKEVVPRVERIAVLTTGEVQSRTQAQWADRVAPSLGVKLVVVEIRDADYDRAFATMVAAQAAALLVTASVILSTDRERIIQLAAKHRLPAIYDWREHVEAGGLMAYGGSISGFTRPGASCAPCEDQSPAFSGALPHHRRVQPCWGHDQAGFSTFSVLREVAETMRLTRSCKTRGSEIPRFGDRSHKATVWEAWQKVWVVR